MSEQDVDVLIVGAGPVGLFLATECARRNLNFRIVESRATQSVHSKALAVFPRTFEIFDMAGIGRPFLDAANRVTSVTLISHQHKLGTIEFNPDSTPYPFVAMVPQDVTEKLLVDQLEHRGSTVEYETTLTAASETGDRVEVELQRTDAAETLRARYVVGCDGAHSAIRHVLNISFEGSEYRDLFMLGDIETNDALPANELQLCPNEHGPLAIFPMSATRRRIVATVDSMDGDAPSIDFIRSTLAQRAPEGIEARSLFWSSYFRIHHRRVSEMSKGRMFLAGDAAHIHSPIGGQGMNTGLQDAWNLAWKLDLALNGRAADGLLASYSTEREPIVKGVLEATHFLTMALSAKNPVARGVRDAVIPVATHLQQFQHAFVQRLSGLGNTYGGSPIVEGHGRRYFDQSLRDGNIASRFLLLLGSDADDVTTSAAKTLSADAREVLELRTLHAPGTILLRPDGYVAFETPRSDAATISRVQGVLRRQARW